MTELTLEWLDGLVKTVIGDALIQSGAKVSLRRDDFDVIIAAARERDALQSKIDAISGFSTLPEVADRLRGQAEKNKLIDELSAQVETLVERIASAFEDIENDDINSAYSILKVALALATPAPAALDALKERVRREALEEAALIADGTNSPGRFLSDSSPQAQWGKACAACIRALAAEAKP